jgi:hypothetical protein
VSDGAGPLPAAVEWTFDPWQDQRGIAVLTVIGVLALWAVIWTFRFPLVIGIALGVYAAWPLLPAVAPAECRVGPSGASLRRLLVTIERRWADVRRIQDVPVGSLLSRYSWRLRRLDAIGSLTLPMPTARRAELRNLVRRAWQDWQDRDPGGVRGD